MNFLITKNEFFISTEKSKIDLAFVHRFLSQTYWSPGIQLDVVKRAMEGSLTFGMYYNEKQIGYARVITDKTTFAYIADVFVEENYQGKGLGKWLIETILAHPGLQGLRRILLVTKDAHKLYEQCGFTLIPNPERYMVYNPEAYKNK